MTGSWTEDLAGRLHRALGHVRAEAWGDPDLSSNVFRSSCTAVSVLYDRSPTVDHEDEQGQSLIQTVADNGRWSLMQRMQRQTIAYREMLCRVDAEVTDDGTLKIIDRPVYPDMVEIEPHPEDPAAPAIIREWRLRNVRGQAQWTRDVWSIYNGGSYTIDDGSGHDITDLFLDAPKSGESYPYKLADGTPVLPFGMWHGAVTGCLWDPFELMELVEGSITCAVYWSFYGHVMLNCSWPQRYAINAKAVGASNSGGADRVITDPATVALFEGMEDAASQAILGQWSPGADPQVMADAISVYERRVAAYAGISPSDVQRTAGDPRSGFAIALNREAQREAQRRYEPVFRPSDEAYMRATAVVCNSAAGSRVFPETGYRITYAGLPASPEERQAEREHIEKLIEMKLMDPIAAYRSLHPELTHDQAREALKKSRLETLKFESEIATLEESQNVRREPTHAEATGIDGAV